MIEILYFLAKVLAASFVCCGLSVAMEEGMVLHFLRKGPQMLVDREMPEVKARYDKAVSDLQLSHEIEDKYQVKKAEQQLGRVAREKHSITFLVYLLKPIVLCGICFASTYGSVVYVTFGGLDWLLLLHVPAVACVNAILYQNFL